MTFTPLGLLMGCLAGVATGVLGAILGTGGGVFLVPVLVIGLHVPMHYAVATSIVTVIATSSAVASANVERGTANMRLGMTLEITTALGAIAGGLTAAWISARTLEGIFSAMLVPIAVLMWRGKASEDPDQLPVTLQELREESANQVAEPLGALGACYLDPAVEATIAYRVHRLWAGMCFSFLAGNVSGLLGVGGGIFKVPALHLVCRVPIKAAAATSNFMIGVTAAASAFLYYGRGEVHPALTAAVTLGVLLGSILGARLNRRVNDGAVRKLFAALLLVVAAQMFFRALAGG